MYSLHVLELLVHLMSMSTTTIVILKLLLYDNLRLPTRLCICLIYSSSYITDSASIYLLAYKMENDQLFILFKQVITNTNNPFRQAAFFHDMGTFIYLWGVLLTAAERLLEGHRNIKFSCNCGVVLASPVILLVIGVSSYYCAVLALSEFYQLLAELLISGIQIGGVAALVYTLRLNQHTYSKSLGERLEQRYVSAYIYKFNRSVLKSLIGEVCTRFLAFSCITAISIGGIMDTPTYGWLTYVYTTLIPVGNIIFPWFIVLRQMRIDYKRILGRRARSSAVKDLNGKDLALKTTADEHFDSLNKAWNPDNFLPK